MHWDNPALLNSSLHGQYGASYGTVVPGVKIGGAGYAYSLKGGHNVSFHAQYLDYGEMKSFDAGGNSLGMITANEMKFLLGYSKEFDSRLVLGGSIRLYLCRFRTFCFYSGHVKPWCPLFSNR